MAGSAQKWQEVVGVALTDRMPAATPVVWVELRLAKGRVLRFESNIDDAALSRLIRAVDAA